MVKVSIVMPAYNSQAYISSAISSIQAQTFPDWEIMISDDGSIDGTIDIVRKLQAGDPRIRLLMSAKNGGAAKARNAAIEAAAGRYIAFLDSDDLWKPKKLERQIAFMQEKDVAFSFSSYDRVDEAGSLVSIHRVESPVTYRNLLKSCVIGCLTAVYDTHKLGKIYMPDIRKRQDFALWLRILKEVDAAYPLTESLAQYRVRSGSISSNKLKAAQYTWSVYRDVEKLDLARSTYYFAHYAAAGVLNTYVKPLLGS
ncbi:glycosyltransferase [Devosia sp. 2618]|uniref:glycosyltransferase family 2 protein n=1 Tax=Devosia sp. 2618 TaxID=3156454 RepID=UPI0033965C11